MARYRPFATRLIAAATLAGAVLGSALLGGPAASADSPPAPVARLQLVLKQVTVHDDREGILSGDADLWLSVGVARCVPGAPLPCSDTRPFLRDERPALLTEDDLESSYNRSLQGRAQPIVWAGETELKANEGQPLPLNRVVPQRGDRMYGGTTSAEVGFAVYDGERYVVHLKVIEHDDEQNPPFSDSEDMGDVFQYIDTTVHGLGSGTHTIRSLVTDGDGRSRPGDYTITWEVRRTSLPDLQPRIIPRGDAGEPEFYCVEVRNVGERPSDKFQVAVRVDGALLRAPTLPGLGVGETTEHCVLRATELPAHAHLLSFTADEARQIAEMNEANNLYEWRIPALRTQSALASAPSPTRSPGLH